MQQQKTRKKRPKGFFARQVWPRRDQLFLHRNVTISMLVASLATLGNSFFGTQIGLDKVTFSTVSGALTAFAALSFGGCITSATVAIALPNDRLLATMSLNSLDSGSTKVIVRKEESGLVATDLAGNSASQKWFSGDFRSHYVELIFTFVYSAYVQLMLAVVSVVVLLLQGSLAVAREGCDFGGRLSLFVLGFIFVYSLLQLVASLEALVSIGNVRDKYSRSDLVEPDAD